MYTKKSTLKEIIENNSKNEEILHENGVPCITCPFAKMEMDKLTLEQICNTYELNVEKILEVLNNKDK
jgi:hybrid cluster-associated redox disulfide protein